MIYRLEANDSEIWRDKIIVIPFHQNRPSIFFFILYKICKIHTLLPRCINIWILEPVGLFKNNGKRSDSATQDPSQLEEWKKFRLALDWTCVDTLATSHDCINNVESSRLSSRRGWAKKDFEWPEQNVTEHNIIYLTRFWRLQDPGGRHGKKKKISDIRRKLAGIVWR